MRIISIVLVNAFCALFLCAGYSNAQDTLTSTTPGYSDLLDDWLDQDGIHDTILNNVAFGKSATQSSTDYNGVASRAVDGITNGVFSDNSVTHTGIDTQAYWQVDLAKSFPIDSVVIYNRTDCCGERLSNFAIKLSSDGSTSTDSIVMTGQCGIPGKFVFGKDGRFVRVQLRGVNNLSLAEVQVYSGGNTTGGYCYLSAVSAILSMLPVGDRTPLQTRLDALTLAGKLGDRAEMQALYIRVCSARRAMRMGAYLSQFQKVIFSQHNVRGGAYFNSDVWAQEGYAGKGLELLTMEGSFGRITHLLPTGEARDPDVSFDGTKILFSWRGGSSGTSDYHLFEMDAATHIVRPITTASSALSGYQWGCVDYEGIYLPNGNILFGRDPFWTRLSSHFQWNPVLSATKSALRFLLHMIIPKCIPITI